MGVTCLVSVVRYTDPARTESSFRPLRAAVTRFGSSGRGLSRLGAASLVDAMTGRLKERSPKVESPVVSIGVLILVWRKPLREASGRGSRQVYAALLGATTRGKTGINELPL